MAKASPRSPSSRFLRWPAHWARHGLQLQDRPPNHWPDRCAAAHEHQGPCHSSGQKAKERKRSLDDWGDWHRSLCCRARLGREGEGKRAVRCRGSYVTRWGRSGTSQQPTSAGGWKDVRIEALASLETETLSFTLAWDMSRPRPGVRDITLTYAYKEGGAPVGIRGVRQHCLQGPHLRSAFFLHPQATRRCTSLWLSPPFSPSGTAQRLLLLLPLVLLPWPRRSSLPTLGAVGGHLLSP